MILKMCKDYEILKNNLSNKQLEEIDKILEHYESYKKQWYEEHFTELEKYCFDYTNYTDTLDEDSSIYIVEWYEGEMEIQKFLEETRICGKMNKIQVYKEMEDKWGLDKNTTDKNIENYYNSIASENEDMTIEDKRLYCYEYVINSMIRDEDLEEELGTEIYNEIRTEIYSKNEKYIGNVMFYIVSAIIREDKYKNTIIEIDTLYDKIREIALDFIKYDNKNMSLLDSIDEYIYENKKYIDEKIKKCFE